MDREVLEVVDTLQILHSPWTLVIVENDMILESRKAFLKIQNMLGTFSNRCLHML